MPIDAHPRATNPVADHETRNVRHKMDVKPEPLKITEADVGRIVYVPPGLLENGPGDPCSAEEADPHAAVIVQDRESRKLWRVYLQTDLEGGTGYAKLSAYSVEHSESLYGTPQDAILHAIHDERSYAERSLRAIDDLESELRRLGKMPGASTTPVRE